MFHLYVPMARKVHVNYRPAVIRHTSIAVGPSIADGPRAVPLADKQVVGVVTT